MPRCRHGRRVAPTAPTALRPAVARPPGRCAAGGGACPGDPSACPPGCLSPSASSTELEVPIPPPSRQLAVRLETLPAALEPLPAGLEPLPAGLELLRAGLDQE